MGKRVFIAIPNAKFMNEVALATWLTGAYEEAEELGTVISVCKDTVGGGLDPILPCYVFFLGELGGEQDA